MDAAWWGVAAGLGALFVLLVVGAIAGWFDKYPTPEAQVQDRLAYAHERINEILARAAKQMNRRAGYDDSFRLGPDRSRW